MIENHNGAEWLDVEYRDTRLENRHGWVVIRICPCHDGQRVTRHYATEAEAVRVAALLVDIAI